MNTVRYESKTGRIYGVYCPKCSDFTWDIDLVIIQITAYEQEINRLDECIQHGQKLLKKKKLNDQQLKDLIDDVSHRWLTNEFL